MDIIRKNLTFTFHTMGLSREAQVEVQLNPTDHTRIWTTEAELTGQHNPFTDEEIDCYVTVSAPPGHRFQKRWDAEAFEKITITKGQYWQGLESARDFDRALVRLEASEANVSALKTTQARLRIELDDCRRERNEASLARDGCRDELDRERERLTRKNEMLRAFCEGFRETVQTHGSARITRGMLDILDEIIEK